MKYPFQNEDISGNGPRCTYGFSCHSSGQFEKLLWIAPQFVGLEETRLVFPEQMDLGSLTRQTPERVLCSLSNLCFLRRV